MPRGPYKVGEFVGQKKNIDPLLRQQDGAKARGESLDPTLLTGPSGTGKSLLGRTLAKRGGTDMIKFIGDATLAEVVAGFAELEPCDVVFFDEAHNLSTELQEFLFEVIDTGEIPAKYAPPASSGKSNKPIKPIKLPPITLIFATDRPGKLLNALHKRIVNRVHFSRYTASEMKEIVEGVASRRGVLFSPQAASRLARVCNGLPRKAEHFVGQVRHHFPDSEGRQLAIGDVTSFLDAWGINEDGLGKQERRYMQFLSRNKSASLDTLASYLGCDADYVRSQVEQPLRHRGLIAIKSSGRVLTKAGKTLMEQWREARKAAKGGER